MTEGTAEAAKGEGLMMKLGDVVREIGVDGLHELIQRAFAGPNSAPFTVERVVRRGRGTVEVQVRYENGVWETMELKPRAKTELASSKQTGRTA